MEKRLLYQRIKRFLPNEKAGNIIDSLSLIGVVILNNTLVFLRQIESSKKRVTQPLVTGFFRIIDEHRPKDLPL